MSFAGRVRVLLAVLVLVASSPDLAHAFTGGWTNLGPGGGSYVYGIAFDPKSPLNLYAATSAGVFKSADRGASWTPARDGLTQPIVTSLVLDPKTPNALYAATPAGVFRSMDAGLSWSSSSAGIPDELVLQLALGVTSQSTSVYAVVFDNGIYRSVDGGTSWSRIQGLPSDYITAFAVDPTDGKTLYASAGLGGRTGPGLYKSVDGGETWSLKGLGLEKVDLSALVIDPNASNVLYAGTGAIYAGEVPGVPGVYKSEDGGNTWSLRSTGLYSGTSVQALAIDPLSSERLSVLTECCEFWSDDAATTWTQLPFVRGEPYPFGSRFLATDSVTSDLYEGGGSGLYRTSDRGLHWTALDHGMEAYAIVSLIRDPASPSALYAGGCLPRYTDDQPDSQFYPCDIFFFKTTDSGKNWTRMPLPGVGDRRYVDQSISLALLPLAPGTILATTPAGVFKSIDAGQTFAALPFTRPAWGLVIDPMSTAVFYVVSDDGLYKTVDGGANWTRLSTGSSPIYVVAVAPSDPSTLYAGIDHGVLRSRDAGIIWSTTGSLTYGESITVLAVSPTSPSVVLAAGAEPSFAGVDGSVYRTTDGGDHWDFELGEVMASLVIDPTDSNHVCAGGYGSYQSFDGGRSWSELNPYLPGVFSMVLDPTRAGTLYAAAGQDGVFETSLLTRVERPAPPVRTVLPR
jgi:photosystem II stability/assembly factor-like uncharacterized protein